MSIHKIHISNFRNIKDTLIYLHPNLNIFFGLNGSGKTSILESLYYLSTGRSFKSRKIESIINRESAQREFILFGELHENNEFATSYKVGLKKSTIAPTQIKVNESYIKTASQLAKLSPVLLIDPLSFDLLNGPPTNRRQFLDWGVFHVEHDFAHNWSQYINCLKQRNSLLRNAKIDRVLLSAWDKKIAELGLLIHASRSKYFEVFKENLAEFINYFSINSDVQVSYSRGWDKNKEYLDVLSQTHDKDLERKYTHAGPHRADIRVTLYNQAASENMSRGQQKLLILALYFAHMQTLLATFQKSTVIEIDDVSAELDELNLRRVYERLFALNAQVITTALNKEIIEKLNRDKNSYKMFHVEHGNITVIE